MDVFDGLRIPGSDGSSTTAAGNSGIKRSPACVASGPFRPGHDPAFAAPTLARLPGEVLEAARLLFGPSAQLGGLGEFGLDLSDEPARNLDRGKSGSHWTLPRRGMGSNFRYRGRRPASGRSLRAQRVETDAAKREFGSFELP
jgi:hypothetical protein